jgi:hypothetical protein
MFESALVEDNLRFGMSWQKLWKRLGFANALLKLTLGSQIIEFVE